MKVYLGDSVYIEKTEYGIKLCLDNGIGQYNEIYMEPEVIENLLKYIKDTITTSTI